jgi:hypothetical protein
MRLAHRSVIVFDRPQPRFVAARRALSVASFMLVLLAATGCSTSSGDSSDTSRANFVRDPFRVWAAIELALIEIEYRVEESDEMQGTIRAVSNTGGKGPEIVLDISQVAYGSDRVSVYVKPSFSEAGGTGDQDDLEAAAAEFMKHLNDLLNG